MQCNGLDEVTSKEKICTALKEHFKWEDLAGLGGREGCLPSETALFIIEVLQVPHVCSFCEDMYQQYWSIRCGYEPQTPIVRKRDDITDPKLRKASIAIGKLDLFK